jgi:transcriptional regulator with XRE-family HTH domain
VAGRPADHLTAGSDGDALGRRLGVRLRDRRLALGRTLADVAGEAELSVSYLSAVEKGANMPSLPVLARLVHALRLTLHELLRDEDRLHVRAGDLTRNGDGAGALELHHPDLRLRVASLVAQPGERGGAPVPVPAHRSSSSSRAARSSWRSTGRRTPSVRATPWTPWTSARCTGRAWARPGP